jgi:hypothetical protein
MIREKPGTAQTFHPTPIQTMTFSGLLRAWIAVSMVAAADGRVKDGINVSSTLKIHSLQTAWKLQSRCMDTDVSLLRRGNVD